MGNIKHLLHRRLCVCPQLLKAQAFPINTQKSINVQQVQVGFGLRCLRLALGQAEEVKGRVPGRAAFLGLTSRDPDQTTFTAW